MLQRGHLLSVRFSRMAVIMAAAVALLATVIPTAAMAAPGDADSSWTGTVAGRITGSDGGPVTGVQVSIGRWISADAACSPGDVASQITDSEGRFSISGLLPGDYSLYAMDLAVHSSYVPTWSGHQPSCVGSSKLSIELGAEPIDASMSLIAGATITGRVTTLGGQPVANAVVELYQSVDSSMTRTTGDADGRYQFTQLAPGSYVLRVAGPKGSSWVETWWPGATIRERAEVITVREGDTIDGIDTRLATGSRITGKVVDGDGGPIAGVHVSAWELMPSGYWNPASGVGVKTNSAGEFALSKLHAGEYRLLYSPSSNYGNPVFVSSWWPGVLSDDEARAVAVPVEDTVDVADVTLLRIIDIAWEVNFSRLTPSVGECLNATLMHSGSYDWIKKVRWYRDGTLVPDAVSDCYTVTAADLGSRLSAIADLSGPGLLPRTFKFGETQPVALGALAVRDKPQPMSWPPRVGQALAFTGGEWEPSPSSFSYQWHRDGKVLTGETASYYVVTDADYGSVFSLALTASAPGYAPATETITYPRVCYPASAVAHPVLHGDNVSGSTLRVDGGPVNTRMASTYQWHLDGVVIPGATGRTLTLSKSMVGKHVAPVVTGHMNGCADIIRTLAATPPRTALAATPVVKGTAKVGRTLSVKRGTWTAGTRFHYRWYANGKAIRGANGASLKLTASMRGKRITIAVTGSKSGYSTATQTSTSTARVH